MAKVQKPLPGLAKFLGIETQGVLRLDALPSVAPVLDIDNYLGPNQFLITQNNIAAVGDEVLLTVPDNRFWRAKWFGSHYSAPVAQSMVTRIVYRPKEAVGTGADKVYLDVPLGQVLGDSTAGSQSGRGLRLKDFDLRPGDQLGIECTGKSGAGVIPLTVFLSFQPLEF